MPSRYLPRLIGNGFVLFIRRLVFLGVLHGTKDLFCVSFVIALRAQSNDLDDLYGHARLPMHGDYTDCCSSLQQVLLEEEPDLRAALVNFAETGIGYDSIKTALNCDDEVGLLPASSLD